MEQLCLEMFHEQYEQRIEWRGQYSLVDFIGCFLFQYLLFCVTMGQFLNFSNSQFPCL